MGHRGEDDNVTADLEELRAQLAEARQSEARLLSVLKASPDHVMLVEADGTILYINHTVPDLTVEQVLGQSIFQYMPKSFHENAANCLGRVWATGTPDSYETVYEAEDGNDRYFLTQVAPFHHNGELVALLQQSRDITEFRQTTAALKVRSEALTKSQELANVGSWALDVKSGELTWSDEVYRIFGISPQNFEATYEAFLNAIHPADKEMVNRAYSIAVANKTPYDIVHRVLRPDGSVRVVRETSEDTVDAAGVVTRSMGIVHDITEQYNAQEALAERERFVSTLLGNLPGMVYRCRNQKDWPMDYVSEGCTRLTGYQPAELMAGTSLSFKDLVHPEDRARVWETIQAALAAGTQFELTYRIVTADSTERWVWERGQGIGNKVGDIEAIEGLVVDHSCLEQEQADKLDVERKILKTQKLESLGLMAGGIAHDFNNLLTIILGNADLAQQDLHPHSPARGYLEKIESTSRRAADLAHQMLAYSGKGQFAITTIDLNELLSEMVHLMEIAINKSATLHLNTPSDFLFFRGDAIQIRQIVMNLITNAAESIAGSEGQITVASGVEFCDSEQLDRLCDTYSLVYAEPLPAGYYIILEVTDSGTGMDPAIIEHIFDPFFSTKFTGRGLGLAATLGIIRGHRGALRLSSDSERGTSFKIFLPATDQTSRSTVNRAESGASDIWQGHGTVLFAEDEEQINELGQQMLRRLGFEVISVADGREAVAAFQAHADEISVVMLDLTMPHMGGAEACLEIQKLRPQTRVVLCSGYAETEPTMGVVGNSISGFLQKPYTYNELQYELKKALEAD